MLKDLSLKTVLVNMMFDKGAFCYDRKAPFALSSSKLSECYIDCRKVSLTPDGANCIGLLMFEEIRDLDIDAIGGLTFGADPVAYATMFKAYQNGKHIKTFSVRKDQKEHGLKKSIEGNVNKGDRVVIVDDVITTGRSTMMAVEESINYGLYVDSIIVLLDRQEEESFIKIEKKYNIPCISILTMDDIIKSMPKWRKESLGYEKLQMSTL